MKQTATVGDVVLSTLPRGYTLQNMGDRRPMLAACSYPEVCEGQPVVGERAAVERWHTFTRYACQAHVAWLRGAL